MPAIAPSKLLQMSRSDDPKAAIWKALAGAVDKISVMRNQVLVGTFIESERTAGGIIKPNKSLQESLYQGITGLVLKIGPKAFTNDARTGIFWDAEDGSGAETVKLDDWVLFRFSSAWEFHLNGVSVRLVDDVDIRAVVESPLLLESRPIAALGG